MALLENVRERRWADLIALLPLAPPYEVDVSDASICSETWIENHLDSLGHAGHAVVSVPGKFQSYIHDCMLMYLKAEHVSQSAFSSFARGRATWSLVDVHHASLLHAKALIGFFGLHITSFRKKSYLIDYFPQQGSKDHQKKFAKEYGGAVDPARILKWTSDQVQQKDVWNILIRILTVCGFPDSRNSTMQFLRECKPGTHSPERNRILYELAHWTFIDDIVYASSNLMLSRELASNLDADDDYFGDIRFFEGLRDISRSMAFDLCSKFFISDVSFGDLRFLPDACFRCVQSEAASP
jgi:hypothetical protein